MSDSVPSRHTLTFIIRDDELRSTEQLDGGEILRAIFATYMQLAWDEAPKLPPDWTYLWRGRTELGYDPVAPGPRDSSELGHAAWICKVIGTPVPK